MNLARRSLRALLPALSDIVHRREGFLHLQGKPETLTRSLAKGAKKQAKPVSKKKKIQRTKKPQPAPKITDPKIEQKMEFCLKLLQPTPEVEHEMSKEKAKEARERARDYNQRKLRQHRQWQADMTMKERIAQDAILALPPHLREEAVKEDATPIPMRLPFPTDTPPREWT